MSYSIIQIINCLNPIKKNRKNYLNINIVQNSMVIDVRDTRNKDTDNFYRINKK